VWTRGTFARVFKFKPLFLAASHQNHNNLSGLCLWSKASAFVFVEQPAAYETIKHLRSRKAIPLSAATHRIKCGFLQ
jgi:hypothetical protein